MFYLLDRRNYTKMLCVLLIVKLIVPTTYASEQVSNLQSKGTDEISNLIMLQNYALPVGNGIILALGDSLKIQFESDLSSYSSSDNAVLNDDSGFSIGAGYIFLEQDSFEGIHAQIGVTQDSWRFALEVSQLESSDTDDELFMVGLHVSKGFSIFDNIDIYAGIGVGYARATVTDYVTKYHTRTGYYYSWWYWGWQSYTYKVPYEESYELKKDLWYINASIGMRCSLGPLELDVSTRYFLSDTIETSYEDFKIDSVGVVACLSYKF